MSYYRKPGMPKDDACDANHLDYLLRAYKGRIPSRDRIQMTVRWQGVALSEAYDINAEFLRSTAW
jgi:hypothetical protein